MIEAGIISENEESEINKLDESMMMDNDEINELKKSVIMDDSDMENVD